jgi:hypothetical protein
MEAHPSPVHNTKNDAVFVEADVQVKLGRLRNYSLSLSLYNHKGSRSRVLWKKRFNNVGDKQEHYL